MARDASPEEIRGAYRRLARQHHPDFDPSPHAGARFRTVNEAYRLLASGEEPPPHQPPRQSPQPAGQQYAPPQPADRAQPVGLGTGWVLAGLVAICLAGPALALGGFLAPVGVIVVIAAVAALVGNRR